jgi:hypothetical protein
MDGFARCDEGMQRVKGNETDHPGHWALGTQHKAGRVTPKYAYSLSLLGPGIIIWATLILPRSKPKP